MGSEFDIFAAEFAVPHLVGQFGERQAAKYFSAGEITPKVVLDGIVSSRRFEDVPGDEMGTWERRETMTLSCIPRGTLEKAGIEGFQRGAKVEIAGERWELDEPQTVWGPTTVTLGLTRQPLVRLNEGRRAAV